MQLHAWNAEHLQTREIPEHCALIRFADSQEQLVTPLQGQPVATLDVICHDCDGTAGIEGPSDSVAAKIVAFLQANPTENLIAQCQAGIGRSLAVVMALGRLAGDDVSHLEKRGTHNRTLYRKLCALLGCPVEPEPLVALAVRVKYSIDRLHALILSLQRQRYQNWMIVAHSDGPNPEMHELCDSYFLKGDKRIRNWQTPSKRGHWGHRWRKDAMDVLKPFLPKYIGISNDDNYYTPGYVEQMVFALESEQADLALCSCSHRYSAWSVVEPGQDLGCWLATRELVRDVPWSGSHFTADVNHIDRMKSAAKKIAYVNRPLFVKN